MDFLLLTFIGLSILMMLSYFATKTELQKKDRKSAQLIAEAKQRAEARSKRQIEATNNDAYHTDIDFRLAMQSTEIDDKYDGRGKLSDEQIEIIHRIFSDIKSDISEINYVKK
jgi:hypothetical protein